MAIQGRVAVVAVAAQINTRVEEVAVEGGQVHDFEN